MEGSDFMKNILQKWLRFIFLFMGLVISFSKVQANLSNDILGKHTQENIKDAVIFTIASKVVNDFFLQNPEQLSLLKSAGYGTRIWVCGEIFETIYKRIFKIIAHKSLRNAIGKIDIFGIEIDNQRLLRRVITLVGICIILKLKKKSSN